MSYISAALLALVPWMQASHHTAHLVLPTACSRAWQSSSCSFQWLHVICHRLLPCSWCKPAITSLAIRGLTLT